MSTTHNVAVFVGSLRRESFNRKMAQALIAMAPPALRLEIVEIGQLPFFNQDLEADPPPVVRDFKQRVLAADAVLFVTPEYNRGLPAVLKNAIDVASRPYGQRPITSCGSRWSFSTSRRCSSPRRTSATPASCSTTPAR
jgi:chromate reductase, NAD(P)H dehydrogenase (quinone)